MERWDMICKTFPSIEGLHNVIKFREAYPYLVPDVVPYRGKIKLHGTNAGVQVESGRIGAQSRTEMLTPTSDNKNFCKWVYSNDAFWSGLHDCVVFGEWCGPGIAKKTAINKIPDKIFAVFGIQVGNELLYEPGAITSVLTNGGYRTLPKDVHVLPWFGTPFYLHFADREKLQIEVDVLNKLVKEIEPCDPWVKATFGVEGICEGIVYYPLLTELKMVVDEGAGLNRGQGFGDLAFKVKGEEHKVLATKEPVQIDPMVLAGREAFVAAFVTPGRLEQAFEKIGGVAQMKLMLPFLNALTDDVEKESVDELKASGLFWSEMKSSVMAAGRKWFMAKNKAI